MKLKVGVPLDDPNRMAALERFRRSAYAADSRLPDLMKAASYAFRADIAAISFVGPEEMEFGGIAGSDITKVPTRLAFCRRVVETGKPYIAKNLAVDPEYTDNPYVWSPPYTRFYAGVPAYSPCGHVLGAFAVLSDQPTYRFDDEDMAALERFAAIGLSMINMRAELQAAA